MSLSGDSSITPRVFDTRQDCCSGWGLERDHEPYRQVFGGLRANAAKALISDDLLYSQHLCLVDARYLLIGNLQRLATNDAVADRATG